MMKTQKDLIKQIKFKIKKDGFCEISFSLFMQLFRITDENFVNPVATKVAKKNNLQFNINWSFRMIAFRSRGRKVGLAA